MGKQNERHTRRKTLRVVEFYNTHFNFIAHEKNVLPFTFASALEFGVVVGEGEEMRCEGTVGVAFLADTGFYGRQQCRAASNAGNLNEK